MQKTLYIVLLTMLRHLLPNLHWQEDEGRPPPQVGWLAFTIARMPARIASGSSGEASTTAARSKSVSQVYVSNGWATGSPEGSNSLRDLPSRPDRDGPSSPLPGCPPWSTRTGRARRGDRRQVRGLDDAEEHITQQAGWLGRSGLFSLVMEAEGVGFEPTDRRNLSTVFKTVPINHSGTPPEAQTKDR